MLKKHFDKNELFEDYDMATPTEKQIEFAEEIARVLEIDFPQSSKEFTKRTYYEFIKKYHSEFEQVCDDIRDFNEFCYEDELAWFQPLNGG